MQHTNLNSVRSNTCYSRGSWLCFALCFLWCVASADVRAGDRQADLPSRHTGAFLWEGFSLHILLTQGFLVEQVADFHDVANDLHWTSHSLLTGGELIFHLL